jgi:hypothetical protein
MRTPRPIAIALVSLALLAGAAACGSEDGSEGADPTTTTTAERATTTDGEPDPVDGTTTTTAEEDGDDPVDGTTTTEDVTDDDAGDADRQAYVDALKGWLGEDSGEVLQEDQVDCVSEGFVDVLGVDELKGAGINPEELAESDGTEFPDELGIDEDKANEMFDIFGACDIDFASIFKDLFRAGGELTAEQESCIDDLLTDENLRRSLVAEILGEDLADDPLDDIDACADFDDIEGGPTAETETPNTVTVPDN